MKLWTILILAWIALYGSMALPKDLEGPERPGPLICHRGGPQCWPPGYSVAPEGGN